MILVETLGPRLLVNFLECNVQPLGVSFAVTEGTLYWPYKLKISLTLFSYLFSLRKANHFDALLYIHKTFITFRVLRKVRDVT